MTTKSSRSCRRCGCTDDDCTQCVIKTGEPCFWVDQDLCSACTTPAEQAIRKTQRREGL